MTIPAWMAELEDEDLAFIKKFILASMRRIKSAGPPDCPRAPSGVPGKRHSLPPTKGKNRQAHRVLGRSSNVKAT